VTDSFRVARSENSVVEIQAARAAVPSYGSGEALLGRFIS